MTVGPGETGEPRNAARSTRRGAPHRRARRSAGPPGPADGRHGHPRPRAGLAGPDATRRGRPRLRDTLAQGPRRVLRAPGRRGLHARTSATTRCSAGKQAYFVDVPRNRPVDVLVDNLEMCHRFDFGDRLAKPRARRSRWRNCSCRSSRSSRSIARTCSMRSSCSRNTRSVQDDGAPDSRHGPGRDQRAAHPVVHLERLGLVADRHRQPRHARPVPRRRARRRRTSTSTTAATSCSIRPPRSRRCGPRSTTRPSRPRWKLRARVGERQTWYQEPEEMGHGA